jgi:uncharacterized protein (DUF488 family)
MAMLTRQKILLHLLKCADRPVQRIELMKWCFLLRHESECGGGSTFYDFVPYKLGPFSFALYQEIEKLQSTNYVISDGDQNWRLNPEVASAAVGLGSEVERQARLVVGAFGRFSTDELLDYVYRRHPAFTVNSERQKLALRATAKVAVYTAGYEGVSIDGFLNLLVECGIERLIDVRSNPIARRYGFHKSTLNRLLNRLDIDYCHFAELGIQSEVRQQFPVDGDRGDMFDAYETNTLTNEEAAVREVSELVSERPSVLVCMEADPRCCHRSRLAKPVSELTGLPVVHLGVRG